MSRYEIDASHIRLNGDGGIIPLTGRTVYIDFCGIELMQNIADIITSVANGGSGMVNIVLRRMGTTGGVPRLIVDRGEIYEALKALLEERAVTKK